METRLILTITSMKKFFLKYKYYLLITIVYLLMFVLMLPLRNQAFDDDFAYINTVYRFVNTGVFKVSEWAAVTSVFQTFWGAIFIKLFGESIKSLHLSNIVLGYFGVIFFYKLLIELGLDKARSMVFSLFLLGSPWIFFFSYSFMSDTFYSSLLIISSYFFIKGIKESDNYLIIGSIFAGFAFLTRQIGIVIFASAFLTLVGKFFSQKKIIIGQIFKLLVPCILIIGIYFVWLAKTGETATQSATGLPAMQRMVFPYLLPKTHGLTGVTAELYIQFFQRALGYLAVAAVFTTPFFLIFRINGGKILAFLKKDKRAIILSIIGFGFLFYIDFINKFKHTSTIPRGLIGYDKLIDWANWWPKILVIILPFWALFIGIGIRNGINSIFRNKKSSNKRLFIFLAIASILYSIYHLAIVFRDDLQFKFREILGLDTNLRLFWGAIVKNQDSFNVLKGVWFFYFCIIVSTSIFAYFITFKKFKRVETDILPILFLVTTLIGELVIACGFLYYFWQEYLIQYLPIILLLIAYSTRKLELSKVRTFIVVCFILFYSLQITRNWYQETGVRWELGTRLVEQGIDPYNISVQSWAWRPYWYFETTFNEAVRSKGGDKYKVAPITQWFQGNALGDSYDFKYVSNLKPNSEQALISDPYWVFWNKGQVVVVKNPSP